VVDVALIFNPITLFFASLLVVVILYLWGRSMAPPPTPYGYKQDMYTGGEPVKVQEVRPGYQFFHIALFFTVLHVAALVLVTVHTGTPVLLIAIYLGVVVLAVAALVWR
jgi:NADH:ubiquinone oxidoreductase subunit 3 (subunit A)